MSFITEQDVRDFMMDRTAEDHILLPDVAFTSEEIARAMKTAARRFNSIQPYSMTVQADRLPDDTNIFFDGIAAALLDLKRINASLNDMDYTAGNVQASIQGSLLKNLAGLIPVYEARFKEAATAIKISTNLDYAYGSLG